MATGVSKQIEILGEKYTYVVFKNPKKEAEEELIYFLSTLKSKKKIVAAYPIRWTIEFVKMKKSDFKTYVNGTTTLAVSIFKKGKSILADKFYHLASFIQYLTKILKGKRDPEWVHVQ